MRLNQGQAAESSAPQQLTIEIPDNDAEKLTTVVAIYDYVGKQLNG